MSGWCKGLVGLAATAVLVMGAPARAAPAPQSADALERQAAEESRIWNAEPAPSDPRDFSGVWWATPYTRDFRRLDGSLPPMTALGEATAKRRIAMLEAGTPIADASSQCYPLGVPRIMTTPYPIQILHTEGLVTILTEYSHVIRLLHLDAPPPPADTPATFSGYSTARWEGDTLVITTSHLSPQGVIDQTSLSHGPRLVVTERMTKFVNKYGGVSLRDQLTIDDPDYYAEPWTAERIFHWRSDIRLMEYSCEENNRNKPVDGITTIQP